MNKLEQWNGLVYVTSTWPNSNRPEITKSWYPVSNGRGARLKARDIDHEHFGKPVERDINGLHSIRLEAFGHRSWLNVPLLNGGATVPDHYEVTPVPCPKVRKNIKTRWQSGRWEKYLKTQGWLAV